MTRAECRQIGGLLSEVTKLSSTGDQLEAIPLPTGFGQGYGLCGAEEGTPVTAPAEPDPEEPLLVDDPVPVVECCEEPDGETHSVPKGTCTGAPADPSLCDLGPSK